MVVTPYITRRPADSFLLPPEMLSYCSLKCKQTSPLLRPCLFSSPVLMNASSNCKSLAAILGRGGGGHVANATGHGKGRHWPKWSSRISRGQDNSQGELFCHGLGLFISSRCLYSWHVSETWDRKLQKSYLLLTTMYGGAGGSHRQRR